MLFSEPAFLFYFLPLLLAAYYVCWRPLRNALLLAASLLFYAWGEGRYVAVMLASIVYNYGYGLLIARFRHTRAAGTLLAVGVAGNLLMLVAFKYAGFLVENLDVALNLFNLRPLTPPLVHMPIGISFFTFQAISYLVDVRRGTVAPQRNAVSYAMYKSLFPQLIAGPIVRYADVAHEVKQRSVDRAMFASGVERFIIGLGKKMILANPAALPADRIFDLPAAALTPGLAWLGAACYALQIYFDFSGYSDMAIGLGRMFGFHFLENFRYPYAARSVTDFWRRWHISLSSWFRDYVYIPLGGNRQGELRMYLNLMTVFFLCGLWHGASWNFVAWGLFHGAFLVIERMGLGKLLASLPAAFGHVYTLAVVLVGWVFFRAETLGQAIEFLRAMAFLRPLTSTRLGRRASSTRR